MIYVYNYDDRIGKGTGYKLSELNDLLSGQTLIVGRKEIEVSKSFSCYFALAPAPAPALVRNI